MVCVCVCVCERVCVVCVYVCVLYVFRYKLPTGSDEPKASIPLALQVKSCVDLYEE